MSRRAVLGLSHTPLLGLNPLPQETDRALHSALEQASQKVRAFDPELIVIFGPDHYNGFFHDLMPPFCVVGQAEAIGDYGTPSGPINIDEDEAFGLARSLAADGFDPAISRRMRLDHGFSQPLQLMLGGLDTPPVIPVFVSTLAAPAIPSSARCVALGRALGRHFKDDPRRILVIGSGGLSHDPPVPSLAHPDPEVRERIIVRNVATPEARAARQDRVIAAGRAMADGSGDRLPLNPTWDTQVMDLLEHQDWPRLEALSDENIVREAGASGQETKCWLAAFATQADAPLHTRLRWYRAIDGLIAGFGIMLRTD